MLDPRGGCIEITDDVFDAVQDFVANKRTGSVQLHFKSGGFASVDALYKKTFDKRKVQQSEK